MKDSPSSPTIRIRPLRSEQDYAAAVELQETIWGTASGETIPAIMLAVSHQIGGIAAGAFDPEGRLLGCVFGLTGLRGGRLAHWSHFLAVRPEARDRGIGRRLKLYQRRRLLALGVRTMYWTFDPLVARNAQLNLERLGAVVEEYVRDLYGSGALSPVDRAIGTDRFIVRWDLARRRQARRPAGEAAAPVVNAEPGPGGSMRPAALPLVRRPVVRVEIPGDIHALRDRDPEEARTWRQVTRRAFEYYLARGYRVLGFRRVPGEEERGFYLLARYQLPRSPIASIT